MKLRLVIVIFLPLITSCNFQDKRVVLSEGFPVAISLNVSTFENIEIHCPGSISFYGGYLLITNNCMDKLLQIVRVSDKKTHYTINRGRGPSEFFSLYYSGQRQGDSLMYLDPPKHTTWINPAELFENKATGIIKNDYPIINNISANIFQLQNNWVINDLSGKGFLLFSNQQGDSILHASKHFPPVKHEFPPEKIGYVYYANTTYNASKQMFVSGLRYFPFIILTDSSGNHVSIIQTRRSYTEPEFIPNQILPVKETEYFYDRVLTSNEHIYALRLNSTLASLETMEQQPVLEVFDWSGKAVCEISFDRVIGSVDIDFENAIIYGGSVCPQSMEYQVVRIVVPDEYRRFFR